jgi:peptidoglycan glycosyltransferase
VPRIPNLNGLGENQARDLLASLGVTSVVVDYQGQDRLGDLYNAFPPYAVVSHSPGAGTPIEPGMTVVLGVRAPD